MFSVICGHHPASQSISTARSSSDDITSALIVAAIIHVTARHQDPPTMSTFLFFLVKLSVCNSLRYYHNSIIFNFIILIHFIIYLFFLSLECLYKIRDAAGGDNTRQSHIREVNRRLELLNLFL